MTGNFTVNVIAGISSAAALLQTISPDITGLAGPIGQFTLVGVLLVMVKELWKTNAAEREVYRRIIDAKDAKIIEMATKVTEAMVSFMGAVNKLSEKTEEVGDAVDNVTANLSSISAALPPPR